jgi:tryptophanyl-tRNA synthetase
LDLPQVFELAWILACYTGKGLLDRAHAYKAAVAANRAAGRALDHARGDVAELDCRTSRVRWRA